MSILLKKSEQNKLAFSYLKDKEVLAAIIHCGYYSCFQKISHILNEYYPTEMEVIHQQLKERRKGSMHNECIKETEVTLTMVDKAEGYMNNFHLVAKQNFQV